LSPVDNHRHRIGEVRQAQIFVAVMGASSFTYVEATWTQTAEMAAHYGTAVLPDQAATAA
jgi:transposase